MLRWPAPTLQCEQERVSDRPCSGAREMVPRTLHGRLSVLIPKLAFFCIFLFLQKCFFCIIFITQWRNIPCGTEAPHVRLTPSACAERPIFAMDFAMRKARDGGADDDLGTFLAIVADVPVIGVMPLKICTVHHTTVIALTITLTQLTSQKEQSTTQQQTRNNTTQPTADHNNNNNTIWRGSVHALLHAGGPTQSQLSRPMSSGHHISMEHRSRRKQLNSDTNASNKTYLKEIQEKRKEETFFLRKKQKKEKEKKLKVFFF